MCNHFLVYLSFQTPVRYTKLIPELHKSQTTPARTEQTKNLAIKIKRKFLAVEFVKLKSGKEFSDLVIYIFLVLSEKDFPRESTWCIAHA